MHFCGLWLLVCEDGAGVGPFVVDVNVLDLDAVLCDCCVFHQDNAGVQRPLLIPCEEDGGAIQPRHSRYFAVHVASSWRKDEEYKNRLEIQTFCRYGLAEVQCTKPTLL